MLQGRAVPGCTPPQSPHSQGSCRQASVVCLEVPLKDEPPTSLFSSIVSGDFRASPQTVSDRPNSAFGYIGLDGKAQEGLFLGNIKLIYQPYFYLRLFFHELIGQLALLRAAARKWEGRVGIGGAGDRDMNT